MHRFIFRIAQTFNIKILSQLVSTGLVKKDRNFEFTTQIDCLMTYSAVRLNELLGTTLTGGRLVGPGLLFRQNVGKKRVDGT